MTGQPLTLCLIGFQRGADSKHAHKYHWIYNSTVQRMKNKVTIKKQQTLSHLNGHSSQGVK